MFSAINQWDKGNQLSHKKSPILLNTNCQKMGWWRSGSGSGFISLAKYDPLINRIPMCHGISIYQHRMWRDMAMFHSSNGFCVGFSGGFPSEFDSRLLAYQWRIREISSFSGFHSLHKLRLGLFSGNLTSKCFNHCHVEWVFFSWLPGSRWVICPLCASISPTVTQGLRMMRSHATRCQRDLTREITTATVPGETSQLGSKENGQKATHRVIASPVISCLIHLYIPHEP